MTKRTKTKAAQSASRVLKQSEHIRIISANFLVLGGELQSPVLIKMYNQMTKFIDDAETAAASALAQKE